MSVIAVRRPPDAIKRALVDLSSLVSRTGNTGHDGRDFDEGRLRARIDGLEAADARQRWVCIAGSWSDDVGFISCGYGCVMIVAMHIRGLYLADSSFPVLPCMVY